jgi:hypothetical protein
LGIALTVVSGFVAFNELSQLPSDGPWRSPGQWRMVQRVGILKKNCGTVHYTVCEVFGNEIPRTVFDFLGVNEG